MTVSQPMTPSGTTARISDVADVAATMTAHAISTPVAGKRPCSPAATVPTVNSAANAAGRAYGAGNPLRARSLVIVTAIPAPVRAGFDDLDVSLTPRSERLTRCLQTP